MTIDSRQGFKNIAFEKHIDVEEMSGFDDKLGVRFYQIMSLG